jgi:hypothetical protein
MSEHLEVALRDAYARAERTKRELAEQLHITVRLQRQLAEAQHAKLAIEVALAEANALLQGVYASRSWRLTEPMRRLSNGNAKLQRIAGRFYRQGFGRIAGASGGTVRRDLRDPAPPHSGHGGVMELSPNILREPETITRIVFTGDIFRVSYSDDPNQLLNVLWLHNLISNQLTQLTEIIPEIRFRARDYKNGSVLIREAYKVLGLETSIKGWQKIFWHKDVPSDLVEIFRPHYEQALVLAFELSPLMERILNRLGCPWVDVGISPLRFLDDLLLTMRLSNHFKSGTLVPFAVSEKDIKHAADHVYRWFRSKPSKTALKDNDVVFFAQTEHDRTLIKYDGSLFSAEQTVADLAEFIGKRRLWIKPHPLAPQNPVIQLAIERLGGQLIDENAYRILSTDIDIDVVTISSSVGREAPWFGKRAQLFSDCVLRRNEEGSTIRGSYGFSDFWRVLLEQIMPVNSQSEFHARLKPNILREQLSCCCMPRDVWEPPSCQQAGQ